MPSSGLGDTVAKIDSLLEGLREQFTVLGNQITATQNESGQINQTNFTLVQQVAELEKERQDLAEDNTRLVRSVKNHEGTIRELQSKTEKFGEACELWGLKETGLNQKISNLTLRLQQVTTDHSVQGFPGASPTKSIPVSMEDRRPKGAFVCGSEHPESNKRHFEDLRVSIPDINWGNEPKVLQVGKNTSVNLAEDLVVVAILAGTLSHPEVSKVKNQAKARKIVVAQALTTAPLIKNTVQVIHALINPASAR